MIRFATTKRVKTALFVGSVPLVCGMAWRIAKSNSFKERAANCLSFTSNLFVNEEMSAPANFLYTERVQSKSILEMCNELAKEPLPEVCPCAIVLDGIHEKAPFNPSRAACVGILCESTSNNELQANLLKGGMKSKSIPSSQILSITYEDAGSSFMTRLKIFSLLREYNKKLKNKKTPTSNTGKQEEQIIVPTIWIKKQPKNCLAFIPFPEAAANFKLPEIKVDVPLYIMQAMLGTAGEKHFQT